MEVEFSATSLLLSALLLLAHCAHCTLRPTVVLLMSALSLPFHRPRDLPHFSELATSVSICHICLHKQYFSAFPPFVRIGLATCLHMHHLFAHATSDCTCTLYRFRSDFLLPPQAFLQCFSVSWTPASSSRFSDGLALQLALQ